MKKYEDKQIAELFSRLHKVFMKHENIFYDKFENLYIKLEKEINQRNRRRIFRECCKVLKLGYIDSQFKAAAIYADAVLGDCDYFSTNQTYEIDSFDTKNRRPVVVDLVMHGYYPFA